MSDSNKIDSEARRAARLAAVQALYQMELVGGGAEEVAEEFIIHRFEEAPTDTDFFKSIVEGVPAHQAEIDRAIANCLSENWTLARVDFDFARDSARRRPGAGVAPRRPRQGGDRRICRYRA